ncbi:MAG TPA: hypothetical protein GXZ21_04870 [Clostridiales bacterium]|nr:hypothetical protein [Clostridiales bacterium]
MGNKRKLLTILISLLILIIISGTVVLVYYNGKDKASDSTSLDNDKSEITRGEWIEVLARSLGMDDFQNDEPYFEDVNRENDIYHYVQSCYEWNVFKFEDKEIKPDEPATRDFMIKTSILATGIDTGQQGEAEEEDLLLYALENGFIDSIEPRYLNETVTMGESVSVSEWTTDTYLNKEFVEYENIEINEDIINYTELTSNDITVITNDSVEMSARYADSLKAGDVFVSPATAEDPFGVAYKVESITYEGDRAVVKVIEPEIGDIYNELEFAAHALPDTDHMILGEGVELVSNDISTYSVSHDKGLLPTSYNVYDKNMFRYSGDRSSLPQNISKKGMDLSFKVNFTKGTFNLTPEFDTAMGNVSADISGIIPGPGSASPQEDLGKFFEKTGYIIDKVPDGHEFELNEDGFEKRLTAVNKFKGGYEITGTLSIKNFYVDVECKTKKAFGVPYGIKYLITESNFDVESTLSVKGYLKEELKISTLPIPLATGITVDVDIILYADFNGELKVKAVISNNSITEYSEGNTKKTSKQTQTIDGSIGAKLEVGPSIKATLKALGVKIVDVQLKTGVLIEAEAKMVGEVKEETSDNKIVETQRIYYKADVGMYIPIVTISIGTDNTLANKVGIKFSWKIYAKSGGLLKSKHIPFYSNSWVVWEKVEAVDIKEYEKNSDALGSLAIKDYVIYMDMDTRITVEITSLPPGYEREDLRAVSGNNSIVQVDSYGELRAISPGSTIITVSTNDGKYNVYCSVTVRGEME